MSVQENIEKSYVELIDQLNMYSLEIATLHSELNDIIHEEKDTGVLDVYSIDEIQDRLLIIMDDISRIESILKLNNEYWNVDDEISRLIN
jgi:uncharacterized small protein (DUF1192 family)